MMQISFFSNQHLLSAIGNENVPTDFDELLNTIQALMMCQFHFFQMYLNYNHTIMFGMRRYVVQNLLSRITEELYVHQMIFLYIKALPIGHYLALTMYSRFIPIFVSDFKF